jgi:outer membrane lipoprotein LolB
VNLWLVPLAALLAGCAGGHIRSAGPASGSPTGRIEALEDWRADGRIAIQRGDEGWSASMRWRKQASDFQLRLIAPLGRGTYQLAGNDEQVELIVPDGRRFHASDAQSLMLEHLGWSIPLGGAQYWLRGLVAPDPPPGRVRRDEAGLLQDLDQAGWRISVLRRMQVGDFVLPAKLFMSYRDLKVRIVISSWKLNQ